METPGTFVWTARDRADPFDNGVVWLHRVAADGTILWASRADYEPRGSTREEWVGHHAAACHADHTALGAMVQPLSKGETLSHYPARLRHKHGSHQHVLLSSSVLFDDVGHYVHTRCFTVWAPTHV